MSVKRLFGLAVLGFIGVAVWQIGSRLSADAIGMGVGLMFGIMAGIPTALLVLASGRKRDDRTPQHDPHAMGRNQMMPYGGYPQQPPVIVLAGGMPYNGQGHDAYGAQRQGYPMLPNHGQQIDGRAFRVVGEQDEWVEEWR